MKVENKSVISIETSRASIRKAEAKRETPLQGDRVDSRLTQALDGAIDGIRRSGLTAGEVHSHVDEVRASGLLKSIDVEEARPRLSDEDLLKLADKVSKDIAENPGQARASFNEINANRVSELV